MNNELDLSSWTKVLRETAYAWGTMLAVAAVCVVIALVG